jgi:hypothetical protein
MGESKTAKASKVVEKLEKKVIPDTELIRLLRIDRASGLYPTTQGTDALLRAYDSSLAEKESREIVMEELHTRIAELETELEETKSALRVEFENTEIYGFGQPDESEA